MRSHTLQSSHFNIIFMLGRSLFMTCLMDLFYISCLAKNPDCMRIRVPKSFLPAAKVRKQAVLGTLRAQGIFRNPSPKQDLLTRVKAAGWKAGWLAERMRLFWSISPAKNGLKIAYGGGFLPKPKIFCNNFEIGGNFNEHFRDKSNLNEWGSFWKMTFSNGYLAVKFYF